MKEASGEANMTVITILLIAIVAAVGTVIINNMMTSAKKKAECIDEGGYWNGKNCSGIDNTTGVGTANGTTGTPGTPGTPGK